MTMPKFMTPALRGTAAGALGTVVLGFTLGGWVTGSKAEVIAQERASNAVIAALAPICVENYRKSSDAQAQLTALKALDSWKRAGFIEERGWAKMPGAERINSAMAAECVPRHPLIADIPLGDLSVLPISCRYKTRDRSPVPGIPQLYKAR